jgi:hypothetical protein
MILFYLFSLLKLITFIIFIYKNFNKSIKILAFKT